MWSHNPSPETERERKEMAEVKRRLSKVEAIQRMLTAQVKVLRRDAKENK